MQRRSGWRHDWFILTDEKGRFFDYLIERESIMDRWGHEISKQITFHDKMSKGKLTRTFPAGELEGVVSIGEKDHLVHVQAGDSLELTWELSWD